MPRRRLAIPRALLLLALLMLAWSPPFGPCHEGFFRPGANLLVLTIDGAAPINLAPGPHGEDRQGGAVDKAVKETEVKECRHNDGSFKVVARSLGQAAAASKVAKGQTENDALK